MTDVRPYRDDADFAPLRAIVNEVIARGDAFVYDAPFDADAMRRWLAGYAHVYVAEAGGQVLGGYALRPNLPGRGSHVCNAAYMVAAAARGRGLGRLLGERSLVEAKRLGYAAMQFNAVVARNEVAVSLWRGLGFAVIGTVPAAFRHADGTRADLHVMHRAL